MLGAMGVEHAIEHLTDDHLFSGGSRVWMSLDSTRQLTWVQGVHGPQVKKGARKAHAAGMHVRALASCGGCPDGRCWLLSCRTASPFALLPSLLLRLQWTLRCPRSGSPLRWTAPTTSPPTPSAHWGRCTAGGRRVRLRLGRLGCVMAFGSGMPASCSCVQAGTCLFDLGSRVLPARSPLLDPAGCPPHRHTLLRARGWRVVSVPFYHWSGESGVRLGCQPGASQMPGWDMNRCVLFAARPTLLSSLLHPPAQRRTGRRSCGA